MLMVKLLSVVQGVPSIKAWQAPTRHRWLKVQHERGLRLDSDDGEMVNDVRE